RVFALHGNLDQRRLARDLEHGPQEERAPAKRPADALLEVVGQLRCDVPVGRRKLEVEVDRRPRRHGVWAPSWFCGSPGCVSTSLSGSLSITWERRRRGLVRCGSSSSAGGATGALKDVSTNCSSGGGTSAT